LVPGASNSKPARPRGRPRSKETRRAILAAASELLDRDGYTAMSIEAIASRAGASKATIYRWWPHKAAVVMDAILETANPSFAFPDTGSAIEDVRRQLKVVIAAYNESRTGETVAGLIAGSQHDPDLAKAFSERFIAPRRVDAIATLERGKRRGELRADVNPGTVIDALYGSLYYRLLVHHVHTESDYADELIRQFGDALTAD
jgi:AcrR family transcriptional regulator